MRKSSGVFLPVEIMSREYDAKLLLGVSLAARGVPVYLGHKPDVMRLAKRAEAPGILLNKSIGDEQALEENNYLQKKGFHILAQDEESGIIYKKYRDFYKRRKSLHNIDSVNRFYCWNENERHFLRSHHSSCQDSIIAPGGLRTTLWGTIGKDYYKNEIRNIRSKYSPYVLFPTNFASGNSYMGERGLESHLEKYSGWEDGGRDNHYKLIEKDRKHIALFLDAAKNVYRETGLDVVLRPHPAEDNRFWVDALKGYEHVHIKPGGPVTPWLHAAKAVVHIGCTTGLEAAACDIPTAAYSDTIRDLYSIENSIPNIVSIGVTSQKDLYGFLKDPGRHWCYRDESVSSLLSDRVGHPEDKPPIFAITDDILNELRGSEYLLTKPYRLVFLRSWLKRRIKLLSKTNIRTQVSLQKRPHISDRRIRNDIVLASQALCVGRPSVKRIYGNCFLVNL